MYKYPTIPEGHAAEPVELTLDEIAELFTPPTRKLTAAESLLRALKRAKIAAGIYAGTEDGGTCNFDSPTLDYQKLGISRRKAEQIIEAAGLRCHVWNGCFGKYRELVICGFQCGHGNCRSRMAEAFAASLHADLIPCGMYYQMD